MDIKELIKSIDIVEYISQFVDLKERNGEFWGLSCFKQEKTPSFSVRRDPPFFYDYSSGIGGNLFTFVVNYFRCSNREAVDKLKSYAGFSGELEGTDNYFSAIAICKKFKQPTKEHKPTVATVLPNDYMEKYKKDYDKMAVWLNEGISIEAMDKFQVYYDSFSNRIVYPIRSVEGNIVNVGGRTVDPDWKEKDLKKYCYFFQWGSISTIYGLYENIDYIKEKKEVIVFEGCKSVLKAYGWGFKNSVAILTSHLSDIQMKLLLKTGCRVVFALDKDVDILADKRIKTLSKYLNVEYLKDKDGYLDDKDAPVDKGAGVFTELYNKRVHL